MKNTERTVSAQPTGWSVDNRGYIHGGSEDTPVFLEAKRRFNSAKTAKKHEAKSDTNVYDVVIPPIKNPFKKKES